LGAISFPVPVVVTGAGAGGRFETKPVEPLWISSKRSSSLNRCVLAPEKPISNIEVILLHVLPEGFQRIRYYGFLANRYREQKLARCRELLGMPAPESADSEASKDYSQRCKELTGFSLWECPVCHRGRMLIIQILPPSPYRHLTPIKDTS